MILKVIAEQWIERQKIESCTVARPRECNHATLVDTYATQDATAMQPISLKALCVAKLGATQDATEAQLGAKSHATFDAKDRVKSCIELQPEKPSYPSIWDVVIQTHDKRCPMVVIDPTHEDEAAFNRELVERFGIERLVSVRKRNG